MSGFFAAELRRRRLAAGLRLDDLGRMINFSASLIGKIENGDRVPTPDLAKRIDKALSTGELFANLLEAIRKEARAYPSGFSDFLDEEARATSIEEWASLNVPGLLQTGDYARALFRGGRPSDTAEEIEQLVTTRLERQAILAREKPPRSWFTLDEVVLRRPVGGPKVMAAQLARIVEQAERPGIVVQIIPIAIGAHAGLLGEFRLLTRPDGSRVAYTESIASGQLIEQPADVAEFELAYDTLRIEALTPDASLALIREIQGEYENEAESH